MRFLAAAGLAGACLATSPLYAADLFESAPPPMDAPAYQTELGTNWYIRGDVGYGMETEPTVVPSAGLFPTATPGGSYNLDTGAWVNGPTFNNAPIGNATGPVPLTRGNSQNTAGFDYDLAVGYRVNDFLRIEGMWDFHYGPGLSASTTVKCPYATAQVSNYYPTTVAGTTTWTATPIGYAWDDTNCNGFLNLHQYNNTALANAYIDLGKWSIFSPYIGAGLGANVNTIQGALNYFESTTGATYSGPTYTSAGGPYAWVTPVGVNAGGYTEYNYLQSNPKNGAVTTPQVVIGPQTWGRSIDQTKVTLAGSLMAGVGVQISQSAMLDIGYRFTSLDLTSGIRDFRQSINLGVRYNIN